MSSISKDDRVLVEGRLQITTVKNDTGSERRIFEIDANTVERMGDTSVSGSAGSVSSGEISKFAEDEFSEELIGEEEIPF